MAAGEPQTTSPLERIERNDELNARTDECCWAAADISDADGETAANRIADE
jgi:hypothetical protein